MISVVGATSVSVGVSYWTALVAGNGSYILWPLVAFTLVYDYKYCFISIKALKWHQISRMFTLVLFLTTSITTFSVISEVSCFIIISKTLNEMKVIDSVSVILVTSVHIISLNFTTSSALQNIYIFYDVVSATNKTNCIKKTASVTILFSPYAGRCMTAAKNFWAFLFIYFFHTKGNLPIFCDHREERELRDAAREQEESLEITIAKEKRRERLKKLAEERVREEQVLILSWSSQNLSTWYFLQQNFHRNIHHMQIISCRK